MPLTDKWQRGQNIHHLVSFRKHRMKLRQIYMCGDKQVSKDAAPDPPTLIHSITFVRQLIRHLFTQINCVTENWSFQHLLLTGDLVQFPGRLLMSDGKTPESMAISPARARDFLYLRKDESCLNQSATFGCMMIYWCYSLTTRWCKMVILKNGFIK